MSTRRREFIATVDTKGGGTQTVTIVAFNEREALRRLIVMGYSNPRNITPN